MGPLNCKRLALLLLDLYRHHKHNEEFSAGLASLRNEKVCSRSFLGSRRSAKLSLPGIRAGEIHARTGSRMRELRKSAPPRRYCANDWIARSVSSRLSTITVHQTIPSISQPIGIICVVRTTTRPLGGPSAVGPKAEPWRNTSVRSPIRGRSGALQLSAVQMIKRFSPEADAMA